MGYALYLLYSTVYYSTVRYSTVRYSTVQYSTILYSTLQYSTVDIGRIIIFRSRLLLFSSPRFDNIDIISCLITLRFDCRKLYFKRSGHTIMQSKMNVYLYVGNLKKIRTVLYYL